MVEPLNPPRTTPKTRVIDSVWTLIVAIAAVGPLALPLLWRNPRFSRKAKVVWTIITALITVLCIWALKFSAMTLSNAMGAEPCRFERHRPAYPPGEKVVRVHFGQSPKFERFTDARKFFEYLKQADGKTCDVNWSDAKKEIEEWFNTWQSAETSVGPELTALIAQQSLGKQPLPASTPSVPTAAPSATAKSTALSGCDTRLAELHARISALKSKVYDSQKTRSAEIESILRSMEPGPLH